MLSYGFPGAPFNVSGPEFIEILRIAMLTWGRWLSSDS